MKPTTEQIKSLEKRSTFERLLESGISVVHLVPDHEGVHLPSHLYGQPAVLLNFSYQFNLDDFSFDDIGVSASLSFSGLDHPCHVPWPAVVAISNQDRSQVFFWDTPVVRQSEQSAKALAPAKRPGPRQPKLAALTSVKSNRPQDTLSPQAARPGLRIIDGGASKTEQPNAPEQTDANSSSKKPNGSHLKRIK